MAKDHSRIRDSPTVWMATVLVVVYLLMGILGGDLLSLNIEFAYPLAQVNQAVWSGAIWMLFTSLFLHANPLHLIGNVIFLLIFGTALEEQVSRKRWIITYFASGLVGNIVFLFLGGNEIGLGASGAIWGLLATAGGVKGLVGMIFYIGLNLFAGGGFLAHAGGLVAGLLLRYLWFGKL
jgi:membrane associated rhomboid family serine protease